ncbi:MAG: hypothetical protein KDD64_16265, partial [Bdellovibrionales bacterium]|nr:hypothetical protein [Bdellovibrionales bacterium]
SISEKEDELNTLYKSVGQVEELKKGGFVRNLAEKVTSTLRQKWILCLPMAAPVVAAVSGGDIGKTTVGAAILTTGLFVMDKTLDGLMSSLGGILPSWAFTLAVAASTNMAELGTTAVSGATGDPILEVPNTPLGSNPWNVGLAVLALGLAVGAGRFKGKHLVESLKSVEWGDVAKQAGLAVGLAGSALSFKLFVKDVGPELFIWALANSAVVGTYLWKNTFSPQTRLETSLKEFDLSELKNIVESVQHLPDAVSQPLDSILEQMIASKNAASKSAKKLQGKQILKALHQFREGVGKDKLDDLGKYLEAHPQRQELVRQFLRDFDLDLEEKPTDWKGWAKIGACCGVLLACSIALDAGVEQLGTGLQLGKGTASLVLMSLFSSAPECLTSMKFFMENRDRDAWKNMADSNAVNVILANFGMGIRALRGAFIG